MSEANALGAYITSIFPDLVAQLSAMGGKASGDRIKVLYAPAATSQKLGLQLLIQAPSTATAKTTAV